MTIWSTFSDDHLISLFGLNAHTKSRQSFVIHNKVFDAKTARPKKSASDLDVTWRSAKELTHSRSLRLFDAAKRVQIKWQNKFSFSHLIIQLFGRHMASMQFLRLMENCMAHCTQNLRPTINIIHSHADDIKGENRTRIHIFIPKLCYIEIKIDSRLR